MAPPEVVSTAPFPPAMKERPILFSAPMVRALLDGSKTQTRRVVKPQPALETSHWDFSAGSTGQWMGTGPSPATGGTRQTWGWAACPYGQPGDRLWVRETHVKIIGQSGGWIETDYRATYTHGDRLGDKLGIKKKWTPAIHMPRAASRIDLEVTGVRVERLQDISAADAKAEGIQGQFENGPWRNYGRDGYWFPEGKDTAPVLSYRSLWENINGADSWDANPWVWVVKFQRLERKGEMK